VDEPTYILSRLKFRFLQVAGRREVALGRSLVFLSIWLHVGRGEGTVGASSSSRNCAWWQDILCPSA